MLRNLPTHPQVCASPGTAAAPETPPAAEEPLSTRRRLFPDLLRLARLAARIGQLAKLLLHSSDQAGASADSIGRCFPTGFTFSPGFGSGGRVGAYVARLGRRRMESAAAPKRGVRAPGRQ